MSEYNELVEKLAGEIVAEVAESIEKEAGMKDVAKKVGNAVTFGGVGQAKRGFAAAKASKAEAAVHGGGEVPDSLKKYIRSAQLRGAAGVAKASAVPAAGLAGGGIAAAMMAKKKKNAAAEKAAEILFESQLQKIAAEEAYEEAQLGEDAAAAILNELGISPEDVLNAMIEAEETEEE